MVRGGDGVELQRDIVGLAHLHAEPDRVDPGLYWLPVPMVAGVADGESPKGDVARGVDPHDSMPIRLVPAPVEAGTIYYYSVSGDRLDDERFGGRAGFYDPDLLVVGAFQGLYRGALALGDRVEGLFESAEGHCYVGPVVRVGITARGGADVVIGRQGRGTAGGEQQGAEDDTHDGCEDPGSTDHDGSSTKKSAP